MGKQWDQPGRYGSTRRDGHDRPFTAGAVGVDHKTTTERSASMHAGLYDLSPSAMRSFGAWCQAWAAECLRVLKPGGHLLAFGGTRTHHRLACAIEDAGFEIRDSIAWLYGSGFPKSLDVSKAIDKGAGAERATVQIPMGPTGNKYAKGLGDDRWMRRAAEAGYHEAADGNPTPLLPKSGRVGAPRSNPRSSRSSSPVNHCRALSPRTCRRTAPGRSTSTPPASRRAAGH